jgi:hypothetical protein
MELDQRRRLVIRVGLGVDRIRNPSKAEVPLGLDAIDGAEDGVRVGLPYLRWPKAEALLMLDEAASSREPSKVPFIRLPGAKSPSSVNPNQRPNSRASAIARQTRDTGARRITRFSILSVDVMRNLQVAH